MKIEKVEMLKTLKSGSMVWEKGAVLCSPNIPQVILKEVELNCNTVKVISFREEDGDSTDGKAPVVRKKNK